MTSRHGDAHDFIERVAQTQNGARGATEECLAAIDHSTLNAFSEVFTDEARARADALDALPESERGRLHGLVVAVKDEVDVAGHVTGYGTRANKTPAEHSSHLVQALEAEGAIIIGHTRMPEFGAWPMTESDHGGTTRNPRDLSRSPGGSSGGTAAAVAEGLVPVGIGGDGGGSIRIPSAHCGLVGMKPRRGRVSCWPAPHLWWALGTAGPLTTSVRDTALIYDVISGNRPGDRFTATPIAPLVDARITRPLRFCTITTSLVPTDPMLVEATGVTADRLRSMGHHQVAGPAKLPDPNAAFLPQFFAGIRTEIALVSDPELLESRTKQVAAMGFWVTDQVREWGIRAGEKLAARVDRIFDRVDVVLTPTVAARPPKAGSLPRNAPGAIRASRPYVAYTALWNVTGHPAIALPIQRGPDQLPISVQLVAREETTLIALARQLMDED